MSTRSTRSRKACPTPTTTVRPEMREYLSRLTGWRRTERAQPGSPLLCWTGAAIHSLARAIPVLTVGEEDVLAVRVGCHVFALAYARKRVAGDLLGPVHAIVRGKDAARRLGIACLAHEQP